MPDSSKTIIVYALTLSGLVHGLLFFYQSEDMSHGDKSAVDTYISVSLEARTVATANDHELKQSTDGRQTKLTEKQSRTAKISEKAKPVQLERGIVKLQVADADKSPDTKKNKQEAVVTELEKSSSQPVLKDLSGEDRVFLLSELHQQINEHKKYPYMAIRQRREGLVKVNFMLHPDGHISNVSIVKSSRYDLLDAAAQLAVESVSPFRLAQNYLHKTELFNVDIDFRLN